MKEINVFSERLKKERKKEGLTQKELAKKLGVACSVIGGAETKRGISKDLAKKLSDFFNTPLDYWLESNEGSKGECLTFETTDFIVKKLIDEGKINMNNIDILSKAEKDLLISALIIDIKNYL